ESGAVVCHDFFNCSPSAQDFFEEKRAESATVLFAQHAPFGPGRKRAAALDNVVKTAGGGHQHRVGVEFAEEGCWDGDNRRDADLRCLAQLTFVTGLDIPLHVVLEGRPPEAVEEGVAG
ncbi:hypothetical protein BV25DRAFT_1798690, partial [Artomyces pyxidatus]